jgi:predicted pyridoxine 5'-phosphate oxidase superfamily flavin-nucleotide-binding protein
MGLFNKMRTLTGSVPKELLEQGLLGRGVVVSVQQTSVSTGADFDPAHVCVFTVEVALDNVPRYTATCRQAVRATFLPRLMMPGAMVAVRVDADDHSRIALSLAEAPPTVTMARTGDPNTSSAARILEGGVPCRAVIVESLPLGMRSRTGNDMYAFTLTVLAEGRPPYQVQVGNPVPAAALPLLYPGNTVPAKRMATGDDHEVVIDWDAAIAQAELASSAA